MTRIDLQEKLLKNTKYSKWYLDIIENVKSQNRIKLKKTDKDYIYYEEHHILPKSMFEEYTDLDEHKWNSVILTPKEHFICHVCIWKHYKDINYSFGEQKMGRAVAALSNLGKYNSKQYHHFKINLIISDKQKQQISIANKGVNNGMFNKTHTLKSKIIISKTHKGKKRTEETKNKISESKKGIPRLEETKEKIRVGNLKQRKFKCPYCDIVTTAGNFKRWHDVKCKLKPPINIK